MADLDGRDRVGSLVERAHVLDVGIQLAVCDHGRDDLQDAVGAVAFDHVAAQLGDRGIAGADQLRPVVDQRGHRLQRVAARQVEDRIDAVGENLPDPFGDVIAGGDQGGAERLDECSLVLARRADDVDAVIPGDLRGCYADATADAVDQQRLPSCRGSAA